MRRLFRRIPLCTLLCLCLAASATAQPPARAASGQAALRAQPGEQATPGDTSWPLGPRTEAGARISVAAAGANGETAPGGFRIDVAPLPGRKTDAARACVGLSSAVRRDLYKTRALEFRIRASRPAAGIVVVTSSNTQDRGARDRFFGSFGIGEGWKTLRLPYGALAPLPGWAAEAPSLGFRPGDQVLRPDSVEDLCIGVEAGRLQEAPLIIEIDTLRFAP